MHPMRWLISAKDRIVGRLRRALGLESKTTQQLETWRQQTRGQVRRKRPCQCPICRRRRDAA